MTPSAADEILRRHLAAGELDLPDPGTGRTAERWRALFALARDEDVSVARLAEAHVDAVSILHEAGMQPHPDCVYAVWASVGPGGRDVELDASTIAGTKPFCSGVGIVDRALIDVTNGARRQLVEISLTSAATWSAFDSWSSVALSATATQSVTFRSHRVEREVGPIGWYLSRPGFWSGACGPAACWGGAAAGLLTRHFPSDSILQQARFGALLTELFVLESVLDGAGHRLDELPRHRPQARAIALSARSAVHDSCLRVTEQFAKLFGPRGLLDPATAQRYADVLMYVRQFHADEDLVALTRSLTGES